MTACCSLIVHLPQRRQWSNGTEAFNDGVTLLGVIQLPTQTKPVGRVHNFGGFTDGDRCVFLANHFKAKKIILLGMDFGTRIGRYSKILVVNRNTKIAKLRRGKKLLEWLVQKSESEFYSTTKIKGFVKINLRSIDNMITNN